MSKPNCYASDDTNNEWNIFFTSVVLLIYRNMSHYFQIKTPLRVIRSSTSAMFLISAGDSYEIFTLMEISASFFLFIKQKKKCFHKHEIQNIVINDIQNVYLIIFC